MEMELSAGPMTSARSLQRLLCELLCFSFRFSTAEADDRRPQLIEVEAKAPAEACLNLTPS
jgi:hypothetical protein